MAQHGVEQFLVARNLPWLANAALDITDMIAYHVVEFSGFGIAPVERIRRETPQMNGVVDVGFRLRPRVLTMTIMARASTPDSFQARRKQLIEFFTPQPDNDVIRLRWNYFHAAGMRTRQLDCHLIGGGELPTSGMIKSNFVDVFQLEAADPTWYDPNEVLFEPTYATPGMDVTHSISLNEPTAWETYPRIEVVGPFGACLIHNTSLPGTSIIGSSSFAGEILYTGIAIPAGETVTIDLRPGYKTITSSVSGNVINEWAGDISTWRLTKGSNTTRFYGTGMTLDSRIRMYYYKRYIGE